jgi:NAD(P)-dependent dehydrogenase (short-subunit alcohol dehydrogenase family)
MKLNNATVLVTGANRGLGQEFARQALAAGARKVYAAARDPSTVTLPGVIPVRLDVTDAEGAAALARDLGDVDLVINNAGIADFGGVIEEGSDAKLRRMLETNVFGMLNVSRAFAPVLGRNGGGALLNVLSVASWIIARSLSAIRTRSCVCAGTARTTWSRAPATTASPRAGRITRTSGPPSRTRCTNSSSPTTKR